MKGLTDLQLKALKDVATPANGIGMMYLGGYSWRCNNNEYQATTVKALEQAGLLTVTFDVAKITDAGRDYLQIAASGSNDCPTDIN